MHRLTLLLALALFSATAWALPKNLPAPGGVAVVPLPGSSDHPQVFFEAREQAIVSEKGRRYALIGIPLETAPGRHEASLSEDGRMRPLPFEIRPRHYPTQKLRIPDQRMVTPPPEVEARIAAEQAQITAIKRHFSPTPQPETGFALPASGRLSSRFGLRRVLNGAPRSPHAGLDLAVGTGTPVHAPTAGTVLAVEDFYFTGNTVVIDHGQGLLTLYAHLSRVDVKPGDRLHRGDAVGASGMSGRATGPHLHWVVILGGTAVDPVLFLD